MLDFSFADWQRRLRKAACTQLEIRHTGLPAPGFAQVTPVCVPEAPAAAAQSGQLHVQVGGIHLSADSSYLPEKLATLLREPSTSC